MSRSPVAVPTESIDAVRAIDPRQPVAVIVLGSGLTGVTDRLDAPERIPYAAVPRMPTATSPGHRGEIVMGTLGGLPVMTLSGRVHLYEGKTVREVIFGLDLAAACGARLLITTNASGAVNPQLSVGDIALIEDHINLMGANPMAGLLPEPAPSRFVPMGDAYSPHLRATAEAVGHEHGIALHGGVYAALAGPSFETAAEIRMLRVLGADLVGMSTVPEVIRARWHGMDVLGLSVVTNMGTGMARRDHTHRQVTTVARQSVPDLGQVITDVCGAVARTAVSSDPPVPRVQQ